jgi:hypothetical protein
MMRCLYCPAMAVVGPCQRDGQACNHTVTCASCGKGSTLSVNLALWVCPYASVALPLFEVSA